ANVICVNGSPELADIGLATSATSELSSLGTTKYAAPEGSGAIQSDLYSFGMVLYEMITGLPCERWPSLPSGFENAGAELRELNRIEMRACSARSEDRYASADEILRKLVGISN